MKKLNRRKQSGFTLIEVIMAVSILAVAMGAILTSQSGSIHHTRKTKEINIGSWLVQRIMVESEHLLEGKPFSELDKTKSEKFPEPYESYTWTREIHEMQFPDFAPILMQGQPDKNGTPEAVRILSKVLVKFFSKAVREMVVTVKWQTAGKEQKVSASTYLVDLNAEFDFAI